MMSSEGGNLFTSPLAKIYWRTVADVAELADAPDSKSGTRKSVWVRPPPSAPFYLPIRGDDTVILTKILIGDVWVASGQSNLKRQLSPCSGQKPIENWEAEATRWWFSHPAGMLYNAMIALLLRFPFKSVIWYQGENNSTRARQYRILFPRLIADWQGAWHCGDFLFCLCK